jgi:hypothetical protein
MTLARLSWATGAFGRDREGTASVTARLRARGLRRSCRLSAIGLFATLPACASLDGLDDGLGAHEASTHHEGGGDGATRREAGLRDAGVDATVDAATDARTRGEASSTGDASDGGTALDAAADADARPRDADASLSPDAGCVAILPAEAGPPPVCDNPDGGVCAPQSTTDFVPTWVPPAAPQVACTAQQLNDLIDDCLGPNATVDACSAIQTSAANEACNACMITPSTASAWGPLVLYATASLYILNVGGCIAQLSPCQQPCAAAFEAANECEVASCSAPSCPATTANFTTCEDEAVGCECLNEYNAASQCAQSLEFGAAGTCVLSASSFLDGLRTFGPIFCGGGPVDGGATDASVADGGDAGGS